MKFSYVLPDPISYSSWDEFEGDLGCMKESGYDAVELQVEDPADQDTGKLRQTLEKFGYDLVAVQCGTSYYSRGNCLSVADDQVRQRTVDLLHRFVDFCQPFGALIVFGSLQGRTSDEPNHELGQRRILDSLHTVGTYATEKNVVICFEPVNHLETAYHNTLDSVAEHVRAWNLPGVQLIADTFHINIEEKSPTECLNGLQDILKHVHMSETNRDVFGRGHWDIGAFLKKLQDLSYDRYCSLGVYNTDLTRRECIKICMDAVRPYR